MSDEKKVATAAVDSESVNHGVTIATDLRPEDADVSLNFLKAAGGEAGANIEVDDAMRRRIMRKIDMVLLPMQA
jgi:hypothetical protein